MSNKVMILGSGISGLLAAWACLQSGSDFYILSKNKSRPYIPGFTYLHYDCNLRINSSLLYKTFLPNSIDSEEYSKMYSNKVYGNSEVKRHNDTFFTSSVDRIFNINDAVDILYPIVKERIVACNISKEVYSSLVDYNTIISTIPSDIILEGVEVETVTSYMHVEHTKNKENYCIFNVGDNTDWYRTGAVYNTLFVERKIPGEGYMPITKVIKSNVKDIKIPDNVLLVGRYGKLDKSELAHNAYIDTMEFLNGK